MANGIERSKYLIVISLDSLNTRDFDYIKELPNFKEILKKGAYVKKVQGVYPSLTYCAHTSMVTGMYPDRHGIYNNEIFDPYAEIQRWNWESKYIKTKTIVDAAKEKGLKIAAIFWPVMGKCKADYVIPEIWPVNGENQAAVTIKNGTPFYVLDNFLRYRKELDGKKEPNLDEFILKIIERTIIKKKPNLILAHLIHVDEFRHLYGTFSDKAKEALKASDGRIGKIIEASKKAGTYDDTTFIILGDHGFRDVKYMVNLNVALEKEGFIDLEKDGSLKSWKVFCNTSDGSAQIHIKDEFKDELRNKVFELLHSWMKDYGIAEVYSKEQCKEKRVDGDFEFMIEAEDGYYFRNFLKGHSVVEEIEPENMNKNQSERHVATHGYDPDREDYKSLFIACGKSIKEGAVLETGCLVDAAPTFAEILGIDFNGTEGNVLKELLKER